MLGEVAISQAAEQDKPHRTVILRRYGAIMTVHALRRSESSVNHSNPEYVNDGVDFRRCCWTNTGSLSQDYETRTSRPDCPSFRARLSRSKGTALPEMDDDWELERTFTELVGELYISGERASAQYMLETLRHDAQIREEDRPFSQRNVDLNTRAQQRTPLSICCEINSRCQRRMK